MTYIVSFAVSLMTSQSQDPEEGSSETPIMVDMLPPLQDPLSELKRRQKVNGSSLVIFLILFYVGVTHGLALEAFAGIQHKSIPWYIFLILIYSLAVCAILCLFGLFVVDPGIVKRSPESCFPIPSEMKPLIQSYVDKTQDDYEPPTESYCSADDESGDTYCTRCLVWRRKSEGRHFHCNTCQRCVKHFDHHCSVFGVCIAGKVCGHGNIQYFYLLLSFGCLASFATFVAVVYSLSVVFGPKWVIPISIIVVPAFLSCSKVLSLGPKVLCRPCRNGTVNLVEWMRKE